MKWTDELIVVVVVVVDRVAARVVEVSCKRRFKRVFRTLYELSVL